jgi:hydroxymethylpyrimidine/phosphomethylpyrimidine kinase
MTDPPRPPVALTIAGSDSSGGAGVQADLKSFAAHGAYGMSVIVALTAQSTRGVTGIMPVPVDFVSLQLDTVCEDIRVDAVKVGMLASAELVDAVAAALDRLREAQPELPIIVDPVMVSTSGSRLLDDEAVDALSRLLPRSSLITPNIAEAAALLDVAPASELDEQVTQAEQLLASGARRVLLKGGHGGGAEAVDVLAEVGAEPVFFSAPRIDTANTHGTGCSLSSAIAALRPQCDSWQEAVSAAKQWLTGAIAHADHLDIGGGPGPVHHFYRSW